MKQVVKHEHGVNYEAQKERLLFAYSESRSLECHCRQQSKGAKTLLIW